MRKLKIGRKLSRKTGQRKALIKTLAVSLFEKEKIKTTEAKAKELSSFSQKQIEKAKKNTLHSIKLLAKLFPPKIVKKLVNEIGPRYKERKGGYVRILKLEQRKVDGAKIAIIELII